eukprot:TRINITY_DN42600_c0_g1_i1.p1 TRINITY_DN42600_c0_g1~~TRINITY_DN42600_c0_g1_i1.p1  ORF type:complete len:551 (-),score=63.99 TRINITY_DN42600_c0_g1_i1:96-1559(-)
MAGGRKRVSFSEFHAYFANDDPRVAEDAKSHEVVDRRKKRVLVIGPGFTNQFSQRFGSLNMIIEAGFQIKTVSNIPSPDLQPDLEPYLNELERCIDEFQPDLLLCGSTGGGYAVALWEAKIWKGSTVIVNAHPSLTKLPEDMSVVVAAGSNDEIFKRSRSELEKLILSGSPNRCFLYYTTNSGQRGTVGMPVAYRYGDHHLMESVLKYDCLPRLIDAAIAGGDLESDGPEAYILRSWKQRLSKERNESEAWLGYTPDKLFRLWSLPPGHRRRALRSSIPGTGTRIVQVSPGSEEFKHVSSVFKASPTEQPTYQHMPRSEWDKVQVVKVERVENCHQACFSAVPYHDALRKTVEDQQVKFEPGVHTRWAFYGTDAVESSVSNPIQGIWAPLIGATTPWGLGTYFARDANYAYRSNWCGPAAADGTRKLIMCLLMTGLPCVGDPHQNGVLPFRSQPYRYNSSVDSLASPELFVVQHPSAAQPAYIVTFV